MINVLLVTDRYSIDESLGAALSDAGMDVYHCSGPRPPHYICIGGLGRPCALANAADVVVLDCDLAGDAAGEGTSSWDLVRYYRRLNLPVICLARPDDLRGPAGDPDLVVLPPISDPVSVAAAVRERIAQRFTREIAT